MVEVSDKDGIIYRMFFIKDGMLAIQQLVVTGTDVKETIGGVTLLIKPELFHTLLHDFVQKMRESDGTSEQ